MKDKVLKIISKALVEIGYNKKADITLTDSKGYSDFSTNIAMQISKEFKMTPIEVAKKIVNKLKADFISSAEVAGPGFINIFLSNDALSEIVNNILSDNDKFGRGDSDLYINVEYVSANPTGHLHIGHARGAALGSALVNILKFAGNKVDSEYYINDAGNQIDILGESVFVRYQNELGNNTITILDNYYKGDEIIECAKSLVIKYGDKYFGKEYDDVKDLFKNESKKYMFNILMKHLHLYNVKIDKYFSESSLYKNNKIKDTLQKLKNNTFEKEGALWLNTEEGGDDKNRVLIKSDGAFTYFTPDLAYHNDKINRGYDELINIWGGDHIGYIKRMEIGLSFLGLPKEKINTIIVQTVRILKDNKEFKMSKRSGNTFTLEQLIQETGTDVARWYMLNKSSSSQFIFDINKAKEKTNDNPIFTVQYTHARINQLINKSTKEIKVGIYSQEKEVGLINQMNQFPDLIKKIAINHKVHLLPEYLIQLCKLFNSWYSSTKAIGSPREAELLALAKSVQIIIKNSLTLLGISSPKKM